MDNDDKTQAGLDLDGAERWSEWEEMSPVCPVVG